MYLLDLLFSNKTLGVVAKISSDLDGSTAQFSDPLSPLLLVELEFQGPILFLKSESIFDQYVVLSLPFHIWIRALHVL